MRRIPKPLLLFGWKFTKTLTKVCNLLFAEELKGNQKLATYIEDAAQTNLEEVLNKAHRLGYQFIIEGVWDSGNDAYLLKPTGSTPRIIEFNSSMADEIAEWIQSNIKSVSSKL
jgi:hypothetical protein